MDTDRMDRVHPAQWLALGFGLVYTLVGLVGFAVTGFDDFAAHDTGEKLLWFELNPLHNIVHLATGLPGLFLWRRLDTTRAYGWFLAVAFAAVFVYGLVIDLDDNANFLSVNMADNVLHLLSALLGLVMAFAPAQTARGTTTGGRTGARTTT